MTLANPTVEACSFGVMAVACSTAAEVNDLHSFCESSTLNALEALP